MTKTKAAKFGLGQSVRQLDDAFSGIILDVDARYDGPDGDMGAYVASLEKLLARDDLRYWPTHGPAIREPKRFVRALAAHRRQRETQIEDCVRAGLTMIPQMVERMYAGVPRNLHAAAAHTVLAHIIHMVETGRLKTDGLPSRNGSYRLPARR